MTLSRLVAAAGLRVKQQLADLRNAEFFLFAL